MNKDNKKRKMAIGAVMAAGVTTGAIAATPTSNAPEQETKPEVELTAADQVLVDGQKIDFDEMLAQLPPQVRNDVVKLMYGVRPKVYGPPPTRPKEKIDTVAKQPSVESRIVSIIAQKANVAPERVRPNASLRKDLGLKRGDVEKLAVDIEREFNVVIPSKTIRSFKKVEHIIKYMKSRVGE